jgi:DNA-binding SARP family transcriptional activator
MTVVQIDLLGRFAVRVDGRAVADADWVRRSASTLVKVLALAPGRSLHREQVMDTLWPDLAVDEAAPRLHQAAHHARRAIGDRAAVVLRGEVVRLLPAGAVDVDVDRFLEAATAALAEPSAAGVTAALRAYAGELLPQDRYEPWAEAERERLSRLHRELLRLGERWEELVALDPADEEAHLALMRAHVDRGDRPAALRQFERMDRALRQGLGVGPGDEALALRDALLAAGHEATLATEPPRLVGRRAQQEQLDRLLGEAAAGRGRTVVVSGEAGSGKSALLDWARARASAERWRCGTGVAAAVEGAWPYAPVLEAFADLCRRHPALLDGLGDAYRVEIERALAGGELHWSGDGGHQRLFVAAAELLRLAAAGTGAVLTVDDVHDADEASLRLLHYLARAAGGVRAVGVLAHRSGPLRAPVEQVRSSLLGRGAAVELVVPPLPPPGTAALLAAALGSSPADDVVEQVHALSGGVPFRVLEAARTLRPGQPARVSGESALRGLPRETVAALRRASVVGTAFDTDEFVELSALPEDAAFAHLDLALAAGVLHRTESGYQLRHSLVRDALLAGLPQHRLRALHRDAARGLARLGASPARVGHHLLRAGDPGAATPHLLAAADTAAALGAYRDALDLVESVRPHASGADRARLLALRADLLVAVGDPGAVAAYREALGPATGNDRRLLRARLARAATLAGDLDTALDVLSGLEPDGGPADAAILLARGNVAYFRGDLETADAAGAEARSRLGGGEDWQVLDLVGLQGLIAHNRGEWFQRLRHELVRTRESPTLTTAVFDSHLCVAEYLLYGPTPYDEVVRLGQELRRAAERVGALRAVAFASTLVGEAALLSGDLRTAERELADAIDLHHEVSAVAGEAHSLQRLAEVRLLQGDADEARRLLHRALPLARWSPIAPHLMQRIHGTAVRAAADSAAALAAVETAEATLGTDDHCYFCSVMFEVPAAIACAEAGELATARRHLDAAERSAALWEGTSWQAATLEARAHVVRAEGDQDGAVGMLERAAVLFDGSGQPIDAARCRADAAARSARMPAPRGDTSPVPVPAEADGR